MICPKQRAVSFSTDAGLKESVGGGLLPTVLLIINHHHGLIGISRMAAFLPTHVKPSSLNQTVRRYPALLGIPFVLLMVVGLSSYGHSRFTQTRYNLHDHWKVKHMRSFLSRIWIGQGDERTRIQAGPELQEVRYT